MNRYLGIDKKEQRRMAELGSFVFVFWPGSFGLGGVFPASLFLQGVETGT